MTNEDIMRWIERTADVLRENRTYLTELDSAIGDADHGINMDRGFSAIRGKFPYNGNNGYSDAFKNRWLYIGFNGWRRCWTTLWDSIFTSSRRSSRERGAYIC